MADEVVDVLPVDPPVQDVDVVAATFLDLSDRLHQALILLDPLPVPTKATNESGKLVLTPSRLSCFSR